MPNGGDANWSRVCRAMDGFRLRYGRWPTRVQLFPGVFEELQDHILTPAGFAFVMSIVALIPEEGAAMIAEDGTGAEFCYGQEEFPQGTPDPPAFAWFGQAILREDVLGLRGAGIKVVE